MDIFESVFNSLWTANGKNWWKRSSLKHSPRHLLKETEDSSNSETKSNSKKEKRVGWGFLTSQKFSFLFLRQWPRYRQKTTGCQEWRLLPASTGSTIVKIKKPKSHLSSFTIQEKDIPWHPSKRDIFFNE